MDNEKGSPMNELLGNKMARGLLVLLTIAVGAGWYFWEQSARKDEVYTGKIVERYRWRDWTRGFKRMGKPEHRYYEYYWVIECDDGKTRDVEVLHHHFGDGKAGDPVKKVAGEVYPHIDTPEAARQRAVRDQVIGDAINGVKKKVLGQ